MAKSNPDWKKGNWSYSNNYKWGRDFPICNGESQSPINIDTSIVKDIGYLKELATLYKPSTCHVINKNNTPTFRYDPGSYIKFEGVLYSLQKFTIHTPSMHTINGEHYDVEICLYHCANPTDCNDRGGIAFSILMKSGPANSKANLFLSQFINQIPQGETDKEVEIPVSPNWNIKNIFPKNKRFFYYKGSLPHPPCKEVWEWVVFEESVIIGKTLFDTLNLNITYTDRLGNIRTPVKSLGNRNIYYQSKNVFTINKEIELQKVTDQITSLEKKKKKMELSKQKNDIDKPDESKTQSLIDRLFNKDNGGDGGGDDDGDGEFDSHVKTEKKRWLEENMIFIKAGLMFIIILALIIIAVKFTKILIIDGVVENFAKGVIAKANTRAQQSQQPLQNQPIQNQQNNRPMNNMNFNNKDLNNNLNNKGLNNKGSNDKVLNKNVNNKNLNNNLNNLNKNINDL